MSFEFLAADATALADDAAAPARSPIEHLHSEAGATIAERDGWRVIATYGDPEAEAAACRESLGIADLSSLGKLELQASPAEVASTLAELAGGASLELGRAARHEDVWWCPMHAGRVLAITPAARTADVRERLEAAVAGLAFGSVTELTGAWASNAVVGPLAREAFARATALDLRPSEFPEGGFAPVSVARTPALVLREGGDRFLHLFGSGYSQYVWTVFADAAESLGGRPVGTDALEAAATGDA